MKIRDIGEKQLIAQVIRPMFNPGSNPDSVGDDCAIIAVSDQTSVCVSTDRVPANLIAYQLGLIDIRQLGYYLAVLNISDLAAAGAVPQGLLLNLGLPSNLSVSDLTTLLEGVAEAAVEYSCPVIGGDLSDANEMNLVATSIGLLNGPSRLYRSGAQPGHIAFCCDVVGITPTAFTHYKREPRLKISIEAEKLLCAPFTRPKARISLGGMLRASGACSSVMDNTDGIGQSFLELSIASDVAIELEQDLIPVSPLSKGIAEQAGMSLLEMALGPGADFQLVGTINSQQPAWEALLPYIKVIGSVREGGGVWLKKSNGALERFQVKGWNYYASNPITD